MTALQRTAQQVALHRRFGLAKRRQRVPKQVYPKLIEMEYAKAMVSLIHTEIRPAFAPLLRELPELLGRSIAEGQRMDVGESKRARDLIDMARRQMGISLDTSRIEALAHTFADRTQKHNAEQLGKQVRAALGVDLMGPAQQAMGTPIHRLVDHFVQENVALIKSIPDVIATDMDKLVTRAFSSGMPHPALAQHIEQTFNVGESRARLIARDQIGKINGQVNSVRQQDLGITSFRWTTVGDERVRSEHEDLNGQQFDYSDPPDEGLPGEPIQCRCTAEPVFESIMAALEEPEAVPEPEDAPSRSEPAASAPDEGPAQAYEAKKNPKRVEAAKKAGAASAERRAEIHSAVKSNLPQDLHVAWNKEGHKYMQQEAHRIKGIKDPINAASKISEAFAETYGSGEQTAFGNEGDRSFMRAELDAQHGENWANEQERKYYEDMQKSLDNGEHDKLGEPLEHEHAKASSSASDDDPPF